MLTNMEMEQRIALVTGAAAGLGRAVAQRLAADGFTVVVGDRDEASALTVADQIGGLAVPLDVADEASVTAAILRIEEVHGRLDALVNNAGIAGMRTPVTDMPLDDWDRVLRVNLTGAFLVTRGALPLMRRSGGGRIVMVASQAARGRTGVGKAQYAAAKAGMLGFARVLADEVGRDNITVNSVAPSRTTTALTLEKAASDPDYYAAGIALTALGRLASPADTANAVAFLCSDQASFLTGAVIDVTGGAYMP